MLHFSDIGGKAKLSDDLFILDFSTKGVNSIQLRAFVSPFRVVTDEIMRFLALMANHLQNVGRNSREMVCQ